ncbi:MAG: hypothetical protein ACOX7N_02285 [Lawsonibacter sp.]|jgi:hypothetical protein
MRNWKGKRWLLALGLGAAVFLIVLDFTAGRLAQPERKSTEEDPWVGFQVVYEPMPPSMEELEANPEKYPPEDRSFWVEYGEQEMQVEGFGNLALPREILIGEYQEETGIYHFPGKEGYNAFLVKREQEDGSEYWCGSHGLAKSSIQVGGEEQSLSGTIYSGPPEGATAWTEQEPDYVWTAYNVFQMADGTVYLDGSGNSYGASSSGMSFSSSRTETKTENGESQHTAFTVKVEVEVVGRLREVAVKFFDQEDQMLDQLVRSASELEESTVTLPASCDWLLVEEQYEEGTVERTVYSRQDWTEQGEVYHSLVLLDAQGMGRITTIQLVAEEVGTGTGYSA